MSRDAGPVAVMADRVIPVAQHQQITAKFDDIKREEAGVREKYLSLVTELARAMTP